MSAATTASPTIDLAEAQRLVMAEYAYWRNAKASSPDFETLRMGAIGATANLLGALMGHQAKWHKEYK